MSENRNIAVFLVSVALIISTAQPLSAQESKKLNQDVASSEGASHPNFGGPDAVDNMLESDAADKDVLFDSSLFDSWLEWKNDVYEDKAFSFGGGYTTSYLSASTSLPGKQDYAAGGMLRFFGNWDLVGRGTANTGALNFKLDHRHKFSDTALNLFSLENLGYIDSMASTFSDEGWRLTNLHWRQSWDDGKVVLLTGLISAPDFLDIYTLGSPWLHFQSLAFTTGAGTISLPGDAALGAIIGVWLNENFYILGGFEDANSVASDFFKSFDTFFSEKEFFKHIDFGWTSSRDKAYLDNFHLTLWQSDERKQAGVIAGHGAMLSFTHHIDEKWLPFIRGGYAKDGASFLERSVSAGLAYQANPIGASAGHLLAIGVNWGRPNEAVFGPGLNDQVGIEAFYRIQVTKQLAVTPDIQYLKDPALNPDESSIWVIGIRARLSI